jgi:hypothetical protein
LSCASTAVAAAQPLLESLYHHGIGIDPATLPAAGCSF